MKKLFLILSLVFCSCFCISSYAQDYKSLISQAENFAEEKAYVKSIETYQLAFGIAPTNNADLYNAACIAALAGDKETAFNWLNMSIEHGWIDSEHIKKDGDLLTLHEHKKWQEILGSLQKKIDFLEKDYDKPLQKELLSILEEDQKYRMQLSPLEEKFGYDSKEVKDLWQVIEKKDAENLLKVKQIISRHGWVGADLVGAKANQALFLVIQHADQQSQQTYLPIMREAVKNKKARASSLALLEDRVAMGNGKKQIYGSQIIMDKNGAPSVSPIEDPDNVDKRRALVGLPPLAEYVKNWKIVWDLEAHKKSSEQWEQGATKPKS